MTKVVVYSKEGCHLCERVLSELQRLSEIHPLELSKRDIMFDREMFERYKDAIPVVEIDGEIGLAGSVLVNPSTLDSVLRRALSMSSD